LSSLRHFIEIEKTIYRLLISRRVDVHLTGVSHAVTVQFIETARYAFLDRHLDSPGTISDRALTHTPLWCGRVRLAIVHRDEVHSVGAFPTCECRVLRAHACKHASWLYRSDGVG